jgi:processive 1,2-diacylglycerol beta-glucosyltransferase
MIIIAPIPGQEERNSDHLLEKGIALKCNEFTTLAYKLDQLLDDPAKLADMRARAQTYSRPGAAETIVDILLNQPLEEAAQVEPLKPAPSA